MKHMGLVPFRKSVEERSVPKKWKRAYAMPVLNNGDWEVALNY